MDPSLEYQLERIEHEFTNHPPADDTVIRTFEELREVAKTWAKTILTLTPASREQSIALTKARESLMWAVGAVACHQDLLLMEREQ